MQKEVINPRTQINLIDDDFGIVIELFMFVTNIKREVCGVLEFFSNFLNTMKKISQHVVFDARC
jgi:hypothetical protein